MQKCSYLLGIPMNHIFPVKNYHEEMDTDSDTDALILKALDQIVNIACDALRKTALYLEFDTAWRTMAWGKKNELEQKLRNFKLRYPNVQFVRILIVGEVGAGKSSFINSVNNAFQKRITSGALVDGIGGTSFTKVYKTHYIAGEDGFPLPFALSDIMGLEANQSGAHEKDIVKALHGFLDEGYKFNPAFPVSPNDPGYRSNPGLHDQTFCLVNVVAADKISLMNNHVIEKLKKIREAATDLNIPQVVIMTRPDLACLLVKENLQKIYTSKKIKEK
ncbi:interferon-induced protein 44-like, partial [Clarias magur]